MKSIQPIAKSEIKNIGIEKQLGNISSFNYRIGTNQV